MRYIAVSPCSHSSALSWVCRTDDFFQLPAPEGFVLVRTRSDPCPANRSRVRAREKQARPCQVEDISSWPACGTSRVASLYLHQHSNLHAPPCLSSRVPSALPLPGSPPAGLSWPAGAPPQQPFLRVSFAYGGTDRCPKTVPGQTKHLTSACLYAPRTRTARNYAAHHEEESFESFTTRYVGYFDAVEDLFELQRGLNNCFAYDLVPAPEVIESALRASRRVNDYSTAVRVFEGIKQKVENQKQYQQYLDALKPVRDELGECVRQCSMERCSDGRLSLTHCDSHLPRTAGISLKEELYN